MILPVVGLLLLLGLFWYWASTLIGDDGNSPGATSTSAVAIVITPENPTATVTSEANLPVQTTEAGAGQPTGEATTPAGEATNPPATEATTGEAKFSVDDSVVTNDSVNLRSDPTTAGDPLLTLEAGVSLTIIDGPVTADNYTWWQVQDQATGDEGWVIEDAIDAQ